MESVFMLVGFLLAGYSVVANDVIQTLGTFLSSNRERPWWVLWLYSGGILTIVLLAGWFMYGGDVSYGRLEKVAIPSPFHWYYILPPLVLLVITRFGIPVSTTFLILSIFSSSTLIEKMVIKSLLGYIIAFASAIVIYHIIAKPVEKYFIDTKIRISDKKWLILQWVSTGFLWSQWLIQDLANIYVFLPRNEEFHLSYLLMSMAVLLAILGFIYYSRGGEIQKIVTSKTNTTDIRSATIIDFIYGLVLLAFKNMSNIPMSTTWVFIGLLAGREFVFSYRLKLHELGLVFRLVLKDLGKVTLGMLVSIGLVYLILYIS
ncbi:hypothetical protein AAG747_15950 [Rapidithrix thailandica]|uniref:Phosphate/sulfate permease n=1 Tax=Rapidithrix thailandica TaxID=413964 RepID=A0AAW9SEY1_9BACT